MLQIEDRNGIRLIALDRPAKRNAIGVELTLAMEENLLRTRDDEEIHTVIFHAIGGHFSAGMDMKDFFDSSTRPADLLQRARTATDHWRTQLLRELKQIVITAVQGYCFGGALPILAASDVVIAGRDARFGLPEINFGLVPGAQIVKAVTEMMTPRSVAHAALTGRPFDAEQAFRCGIVSEIVDGDPLHRALEIATQAASKRH